MLPYALTSASLRGPLSQSAFFKKKIGMFRQPIHSINAIVLALTLVACGAPAPEADAPETDPADMGASADMSGPATDYEWDSSWPKELPNNWLVGNVVGVAVDSTPANTVATAMLDNFMKANL